LADYEATTVYLQRKTSSQSLAETLIASQRIFSHNFRFAADTPRMHNLRRGAACLHVCARDAVSKMFSDAAEALKTQYTDKYVKVDARRPELARFRDAVGQVKTVNMNGRALVEFLDYHLNTGWFDIDLSCLTVVDKPAPAEANKAEAKPAPAKPSAAKPAPAAGEKKLSPLEMARMQGAGGKSAAAAPAKPAADKPAGAKKSTADILAAARGGTASPAPAAPANPAGGKPSTADILAAARGKSAAPAATAPVAPAPKPESPAAAAAPPPPAAPTPAPAPAASGGIVRVDKSSMSIADMVAYCRSHDAK
jgi:hypothetical protein